MKRFNSNHINVYLNDGTANTARLGIKLGIPSESTRHCKIWYDGTNVYGQLNDGDVVVNSNLSTNGQFENMGAGFQVLNQTYAHLIKNFIIYPIYMAYSKVFEY